MQRVRMRHERMCNLFHMSVTYHGFRLGNSTLLFDVLHNSFDMLLNRLFRRFRRLQHLLSSFFLFRATDFPLMNRFRGFFALPSLFTLLVAFPGARGLTPFRLVDRQDGEGVTIDEPAHVNCKARQKERRAQLDAILTLPR